MRLTELILPKGASRDRSLSPQIVRKIDALQMRMDSYVDKIMSPNTSTAGKEFLKSKLRDDYHELRDLLPKTHEVAEGWQKSTLVDVNKKGSTVPKNPKGGHRTCDKCGKTFSRLGIGKHRCIPKEVKEEYKPDPVDDAESIDILRNEPYELDTDPIDAKRIIAKYMSHLPERYQQISKLRFWDEYSLAEVGEIIGVTPERVRQIEARIMRKLRHLAGEDARVEREVRDHYNLDEEKVTTQYEIFDRKTNQAVPGLGPFPGVLKVTQALSQLPNNLGGRRYGYRPIQNVSEAFDSAVPYRWVVSDKNDAMAYFTVGDVDYTFKGESDSRNNWLIKFAADLEGEEDMGDTGTGNPLAVFSTAKAIFLDFISKYEGNISSIMFVGANAQRTAINRRIFQAPGWKAKETERGGPTTFILTPRKKGWLSEAVTKLPISNDDFELVKKMMEKPIPAIIAPIYIQQIIEDDELNDQLASLEEDNPGMDVRPLIAEWFNRVMPDQMSRFTGDVPSYAQKNGVLSVIHGYDSHEYKGQNNPITGDAYGFR